MRRNKIYFYIISNLFYIVSQPSSEKDRVAEELKKYFPVIHKKIKINICIHIVEKYLFKYIGKEPISIYIYIRGTDFDKLYKIIKFFTQEIFLNIKYKCKHKLILQLFSHAIFLRAGLRDSLWNIKYYYINFI